MRGRVAHMASFKQAVAVLSIGFVGCSSPSPDVPTETAWGEARVVEELSIGVESGPDEYMLGRVRDVSVAPDGTIYVYDQQPSIIRKYDRTGNFVGNVGRAGQGPGEYQFPVLRALTDNRLAVWDYRSGRVSFFSPEGDYERGVSVDGSIAGTFQTDPDGNLVIMKRTDVDARPQDVLWKYSVDGELLETLPLPPLDIENRYFGLSYEGAIKSFPVENVWAWSPLGYVVVGRNDRYRIELQKPSGTEYLGREVGPAAVGSAELAEWNAFRNELAQREIERGRDAELNPIPSEKPFFRTFHAADDGRIWVFRYVAAAKRDDVEPVPERPERPLLTWREPWTYDVFEPDGTFLGSVVVPELFQPHVFRGEQIWGVLVDEVSVERIVRLRVLPEAR